MYIIIQILAINLFVYFSVIGYTTKNLAEIISGFKFKSCTHYLHEFLRVPHLHDPQFIL